MLKNGEGKEGHADGHGQLPHGEAGTEQGIDVFQYEAPVLKEAQKQQIDCHRGDQGESGGITPALRLLMADLQTGEVVEQNT